MNLRTKVLVIAVLFFVGCRGSKKPQGVPGRAVIIADKLGVSHFIIGLTVVSLGTSLPELGASIFAALSQDSGIVIGNIVGSNIANTAFILGIGVLFRKII